MYKKKKEGRIIEFFGFLIQETFFGYNQHNSLWHTKKVRKKIFSLYENNEQKWWFFGRGRRIKEKVFFLNSFVYLMFLCCAGFEEREREV